MGEFSPEPGIIDHVQIAPIQENFITTKQKVRTAKHTEITSSICLYTPQSPSLLCVLEE